MDFHNKTQSNSHYNLLNFLFFFFGQQKIKVVWIRQLKYEKKGFQARFWKSKFKMNFKKLKVHLLVNEIISFSVCSYRNCRKNDIFFP